MDSLGCSVVRMKGRAGVVQLGCHGPVLMGDLDHSADPSRGRGGSARGALTIADFVRGCQVVLCRALNRP
jgi:hypothetical protein